MIKSANISRTRKVVNLLLFVIFTLFAVIQLNDPDPVRWFVIYIVVAFISLISYFWIVPRSIIWILVIVYFSYAIYHIPYYLEYLDVASSNEIFAEMKVEKPYLEGTREFFGMLFAAVGLLYQLKKK